MHPFDRRRAFPGRAFQGRTAPAVFTFDDLDRDLTALMQDPLYWRERDRDFADHVTRQFERIHGPDGPTPDADGKRRGTLEVPRLRRRPGDDRLKQPVGRDAPNQPDDVARLQRALSETSDYTFTAPRERSGVMTANLDTALTRYQRRTGLKPDGVVAPGGPTVQQIAAEAEWGGPERSARADVNDTSENLADFQSTERLSETANKKSEQSNSAAILANNTAPTATDKKERDCSGIQTNLHEAHQHANTLSDLAKTKRIEIRDLRQSIAEFANLEEFVNEQMLGEAIERALRRSPAGLIAFEIVDGIRNINTVKTAQNLTQRLQNLLYENALLHNDLEKQLKKVEQLRAKYNECLTRPAPEDENETGPAVPTS